MRQTGTLYSKKNSGNTEIKEPIPSVFIYFSQSGIRKLSTKTTTLGKFDFDLPLGVYDVSVSRGGQDIVYDLAVGAKFELKSNSAIDAFEKWVLAPPFLADNPLITLMQSILNETKEIADRVEGAESSLIADIEKKRDKTDNVFTQFISAKCDGSGAGSGVYFMNENNSINGNIIGNKQGVQINQVINGDNSSFLFPNKSGIHHLGVQSDIDKKWDKEEGTTALAKKQDTLEFIGNGKVMKEGAGGLLSTFRPTTRTDLGNETWFPFNGFQSGGADRYSQLLVKGATLGAAGNPDVMAINMHRRALMWHNLNTTIDSNGFLKAASPVLRLFNDRIEHNEQFENKPLFEKLGVGVYKISNTLGLAKEGWYIDTPKDKNGFPYFLVEWEQLENNDVIIRTFKKKIDLETLDFVNGEPVDIQEDQRWIDLRFHEDIKDNNVLQ